MEFDKTKVFTTFNCDEVKVGSKGYFADSKESLVTKVQLEDKDDYRTLVMIDINSEFALRTEESQYLYFYLVEEPKELVPFDSVEELIEFWVNKRFKGRPQYNAELEMPLVWVTHKASNEKYLINSFKDGVVSIGGLNFILKDLFKFYTFLDGSPIGKIKE